MIEWSEEISKDRYMIPKDWESEIEHISVVPGVRIEAANSKTCNAKSTHSLLR